MSNEHSQRSAEQLDDQVVEAKKTSILFERYTYLVLIVFILLAIWYNFLPLIAICTLLLLLTVVMHSWKNKALTNVIPTLQLSRTRLFVDDEFHLKAAIFNDRWLPLVWLEWEFLKTSSVMFGEEKKNAYIYRFLWLLSFRKVQWTTTGKALARGVYEIGKITLRSGDGFRLSEKEESYNLHTKLYVYPKLTKVKNMSLNDAIQFEAKGKNGGYIEDPLLVAGVREYQPGDELRRFNWKASARTGKLQTNIYQPVVTKELLICIDVEGFIIDETKYEDETTLRKYVTSKKNEFEKFLSIIASIIVHFHQRGIRVGLLNNSKDYFNKTIELVLPTSSLTPILDPIAKMTQQIDKPIIKKLRTIAALQTSSSPLFIFCEEITSDHFYWYKKHQHQLAEVRFYYHHENEYAKKLDTVSWQIDRLLA